MTPQFEILTTIRCRRKIITDSPHFDFCKSEIFICNDINIFYGKSEQVVKENFELAKEYYKDVFRTLRQMMYFNAGKYPPESWETLVI